MKKFTFTINGNPYDVAINDIQNGKVDMDVNGKNFTIEIEREKPVVTPPTPQEKPKLIEPKAPAPKPTNSGDQPLTTLKVYVASGQSVKKGDKLFTMESMGKECNVTADKDGIIGKINVAVGKNIATEGVSMEMQASGNATNSTNVNTSNADTAPLPGTIVQILKSVGDSISVGDVILTMDSMKMVNNVLASKSGILKHILVTERQAVLEGDPLFIIE